MKIKIIALAISVLAGAGIALGPAAPASAWGEACPNGQFCAWDQFSGVPQPWTFPFTLYDPVGTCWNLGSTDNRWSSVWNRYGSYGGHLLAMGIYVDYNCSLQYFSGATVNNNVKRNFDGGWGFLNNEVSSFRIVYQN